MHCITSIHHDRNSSGEFLLLQRDKLKGNYWISAEFFFALISFVLQFHGFSLFFSLQGIKKSLLTNTLNLTFVSSLQESNCSSWDEKNIYYILKKYLLFYLILALFEKYIYEEKTNQHNVLGYVMAKVWDPTTCPCPDGSV